MHGAKTVCGCQGGFSQGGVAGVGEEGNVSEGAVFEDFEGDADGALLVAAAGVFGVVGAGEAGAAEGAGEAGGGEI